MRRWIVGGSGIMVALIGFLSFATRSTVFSQFDSSNRVLYQTSWRHGAGGWLSSGGGWVAHKGQVTFTGKGRSTFVAPYRVHRSQYALTASIRLVRYHAPGISVANSFGLLFSGAQPMARKPAAGLGAGVVETRSVSGQVYTAAIVTDPNDPSLDNASFNYENFDPSTAWHTYRVDVSGVTVTLRIDGKLLVTVDEPTVPTGTKVGFYSTTSQIEVAGFKVLSR